MGLTNWFFGVGAIFLGIAVSVWNYTEVNKTIIIWGLGYVGLILLATAAGLEVQKYANSGLPTASNLPDPIPGQLSSVVQKRASVIVLYGNEAPKIGDLPNWGKTLEVSFFLRDIGDTTAIVKSIRAHIFLADQEPDPGTPEGLATKEDMIKGNNVEPFASTLFFAGQSQILIEAGQIFTPIEKLFVAFKKARIDAINGLNFQFLWVASHIWLRVVVIYDDPYQAGRETSYWVQLSGTGALAAKNSQYNYQK